MKNSVSFVKSTQSSNHQLLFDYEIDLIKNEITFFLFFYVK
jgi:hypothetical protein